MANDDNHYDDLDRVPIITVDGPSSSGKGTLSRKLAKALGWHFLDSGLIYRILALKCIWVTADLENESALETLALSLNCRFEPEILLEGKAVQKEVRSEYCGNVASKISVYPRVRQALLQRQRAFSKPPGLVADGRDMGTIVFPEANLKIFLTASSTERAKRRYLELKNGGHHVSLDNILQEIEARDKRDKERAISPLKPADDAWVVDTTELGVEAVFDTIMREIKGRFYKM